MYARTIALLLICLCYGCSKKGTTPPGSSVEILATIETTPNCYDSAISKSMPPKFRIMEEADQYLTCISCNGKAPIFIHERNVDVPRDEWENLLDGETVAEVSIDIYLNKEKIWYKYPIIRKQVEG